MKNFNEELCLRFGSIPQNKDLRCYEAVTSGSPMNRDRFILRMRSPEEMATSI